MRILDINSSINECSEQKITVKIEDKKDLILIFHGEQSLPNINDCVFLSLFIQSMEEGTDIFMPEKFSVSEILVANMRKLQAIFSQWFPQSLQEITIHVSTHKANVSNATGCLSLFSGGVDSFYTFLENQSEISHVFLCIGLDIQLEETVKREKAIIQYKALAKDYGKELLIASTNMRHVFPEANRMAQHAALFSALVLAYGMKKLYIPASHQMNELFPWGSHLLTDPLMSNGVTEVIHHGAVSRSSKTEVICRDKKALDALRICNTSEDLNCGQCEKCIRTIFALDILQCHSTNLPKLDNELLSQLKIHDTNQFSFWQDNYLFAIKHKRYDLAKYAKKIIKRFEWRQWFKKGLQLLSNKD
jgi:hypothetical protein